MAHRVNKSVIRVDSSEIMGEGSFVTIRRMTWGQMQEMFPQAETLDERAMLVQSLPNMVIDWDWVDDDGNPLPKPHGNREVLDALPDIEIAFLISAVSKLKPAEIKN